MANIKNTNGQYKTKADVEKYLKSDKSFMANRSAAEFDAFVEGAMWMMAIRDLAIKKLQHMNKSAMNKVLELEKQLAPYTELYENYEFVEKKNKKRKVKIDRTGEEEDDDEIVHIIEDEYAEIDDYEDMDEYDE